MRIRLSMEPKLESEQVVCRASRKTNNNIFNNSFKLRKIVARATEKGTEYVVGL